MKFKDVDKVINIAIQNYFIKVITLFKNKEYKKRIIFNDIYTLNYYDYKITIYAYVNINAIDWKNFKINENNIYKFVRVVKIELELL